MNLKNSNCDETQNSNCDETKKTQIAMQLTNTKYYELKYLNWDET